MNKKPKIAIIGLSGESVFMKVDHFHKKGETIVSDEFYVEPGGKGYNQAVAVNRLGGEAHFLSSVGDDSYGEECEHYLVNEGVVPYFVKKKNKKTAFATILTDKIGENQVTVFKGASKDLSLVDIDIFKEVIQSSDLLLLQLETDKELLNKAIDFANAANVKIILNPAPAIGYDDEMLKKVWAITPNENEARKIFSLEENISIDSIVEKVKEKEIKRVIITLGDKGALIINEGILKRIPPVKAKAIDTTGAGDVFNAAFSVKIALGNNVEEAVTFANVAAALSVEKEHVLSSIPYLEDVEKRMK